MSDMNTRIEQFRKMANDDPNNEIGHFSLARALLDAGRADEAIASFKRVIEINPNMSRGWQYLAMAQLRADDKPGAIDSLTKGTQAAHSRGDIMPRNEMAKMLKELGAPVPEFKLAQPERPVGEGEVHCGRCGKIGPKLPKPPFRNAVGEQIFVGVCAPCWKEWIAMGTKVINELRLPLSDPAAQKVFDQHMMEFLNLK